MSTVIFVESPVDPNKKFRLGRQPSVFVNGAEFTFTGYRLGNYTVDGASTKYSAKAQAFELTTSLGENISSSRLIKGRRVLYDAEGKLVVIQATNFGPILEKFLVETFGRDEKESEYLNATAEQVAQKTLEFFQGKTIIVAGLSLFDKDENGRMFSTVGVQFQIKA
jgi:hypothetical protein